MLIRVDKYTFKEDADLARVCWESLSPPFTIQEVLS